MEQGIEVNTNVNIGLAMSPRLLQSVSILQCNTVELDQAITAAITNNPMLEEDEPGEVPQEPEESRTEDDGADHSIDIDESDEFYGGSTAEDWESHTGTPGPEVESHEKTMQDILRDSLQLWQADGNTLGIISAAGATMDRFKDIVLYVVDSLDSDGLLRADELLTRNTVDDQDFESIEKFIDGYDSSVLTPLAAEAIRVVKQIGPSGIAERTVRESLIEQAKDYGVSDLAMKLLVKHFDLFENMQYGKLSAKMGIAAADIRSAVDEIKHLSIHPADVMTSSPSVIYPEVRFIRKNRRVIAEAVRSHRGIHINELYAGMVSDRSLPPADRKYMKSKLEDAKATIKFIGDRYRTIEAVCNAIIRRQKAYFSDTPGDLVPMTLQDIAADTGLSASTVSRVTSNKYADTSYGLLELGKLFTNGMPTASGESVSSAKVIERVREIIESEDKRRPLTDQAIADMLVNEGFKISRRGVAKYREDVLHIPSTHKRKEN